ncbi:hypothetical protein [Microvirga sp. 2TAF3]|uniref:hypothetical protein n=1 Tax=Microvirga sp. 2TAF3 TaxID=3233014 RepID=UPI003F948B2C
MKRLPFVAAIALAFAFSAPLIGVTASSASAQGWSDEDGGDGGGNWRQERRGQIMDMLQNRRDRRAELMDMLQNRRDRRAELMDMLQERGGRRGELLDLIRERRGLSQGGCYFVTRSLADEERDFVIMVRRRVCDD